MADISKLSRLLNGVQRQVDLSANTILTDNLKIKMGSGNDANHATFSGSLTAARTISMPDANVALGDIATNKTHVDGDGSDHADVATNTTHSGGDGSDHADVATNTTHSSGDGSDHQDVADHTTLSGSAANSTNHGAFSGATLSDTETTRSALQTLETKAESNATDLSNHLSDAVDAHDASAISSVAAGDLVATDVQAALNELDTEKLALAGGTMSGAIAMGSNKITGLTDGSASSDAVNFSQLQAAFNDLDRKNGVDLVEISNLTLSGEQTIDGVLTSTSRVLLTGQTDKSENGIYVTAAGAWARSSDADAPSEVTLGLMTTAEQGSARSGTVWLLTTVNATPTVIDTTELTFTELPNELITASTGLTKSGADIQLADAAENASGIKVLSGVITLEDLGAFDTDDLAEGATNLYFTETRVRATVLTGFVSGAGTVAAADSVLSAINKLDGNNIATQAAVDAVEDNTITSTDGSISSAGTIGADDQVVETVFSTAGTANRSIDAADLASNANALGAALVGIEDVAGNITATDVEGALAEIAAAVSATEIVSEAMVAGESFAANSSFLVRMALSGETAGRVYKADKGAGSAGSETNTIYVIGLAQNTTGSPIAAAGSISVIKLGEATLQSSDGTFTASSEEGLPVYLGASGAFTLTAPSATDDAVVWCGNVRNVGGSSAIEIKSAQVMGIEA